MCGMIQQQNSTTVVEAVGNGARHLHTCLRRHHASDLHLTHAERSTLQKWVDLSPDATWLPGAPHNYDDSIQRGLHSCGFFLPSAEQACGPEHSCCTQGDVWRFTQKPFATLQPSYSPQLAATQTLSVNLLLHLTLPEPSPSTTPFTYRGLLSG